MHEWVVSSSYAVKSIFSNFFLNLVKRLTDSDNFILTFGPNCGGGSEKATCVLGVGIYRVRGAIVPLFITLLLLFELLLSLPFNLDIFGGGWL